MHFLNILKNDRINDDTVSKSSSNLHDGNITSMNMKDGIKINVDKTNKSEDENYVDSLSMKDSHKENVDYHSVSLIERGNFVESEANLKLEPLENWSSFKCRENIEEGSGNSVSGNYGGENCSSGNCARGSRENKLSGEQSQGILNSGNMRRYNTENCVSNNRMDLLQNSRTPNNMQSYNYVSSEVPYKGVKHYERRIYFRSNSSSIVGNINRDRNRNDNSNDSNYDIYANYSNNNSNNYSSCANYTKCADYAKYTNYDNDFVFPEKKETNLITHSNNSSFGKVLINPNCNIEEEGRIHTNGVNAHNTSNALHENKENFNTDEGCTVGNRTNNSYPYQHYRNDKYLIINNKDETIGHCGYSKKEEIPNGKKSFTDEVYKNTNSRNIKLVDSFKNSNALTCSEYSYDKKGINNVVKGVENTNENHDYTFNSTQYNKDQEGNNENGTLNNNLNNLIQNCEQQSGMNYTDLVHKKKKDDNISAQNVPFRNSENVRNNENVMSAYSNVDDINMTQAKYLKGWNNNVVSTNYELLQHVKKNDYNNATYSADNKFNVYENCVNSANEVAENNLLLNQMSNKGNCSEFLRKKYLDEGKGLYYNFINSSGKMCKTGRDCPAGEEKEADSGDYEKQGREEYSSKADNVEKDKMDGSMSGGKMNGGSMNGGSMHGGSMNGTMNGTLGGTVNGCMNGSMNATMKKEKQEKEEEKEEKEEEDESEEGKSYQYYYEKTLDFLNEEFNTSNINKINDANSMNDREMFEKTPFFKLVNFEKKLAMERNRVLNCYNEDKKQIYLNNINKDKQFSHIFVNNEKYYDAKEILAYLLPYHTFYLDGICIDSSEEGFDFLKNVQNDVMDIEACICQIKESFTTCTNPAMVWSFNKIIDRTNDQHNKRKKRKNITD
ncbi:hypothetical protein MKS88_002531 [Plasmodium brasilianum]|uniref:Uncharacterized protein n=1 Tax=Plasmodium brasilianum TaxID=5824 RepID=A0ACB9YAA2_PLABR|nr:hypothetical protein MKS88_002531 [Plasmodium brasilianum]